MMANPQHTCQQHARRINYILLVVLLFKNSSAKQRDKRESTFLILVGGEQDAIFRHRTNCPPCEIDRPANNNNWQLMDRMREWIPVSNVISCMHAGGLSCLEHCKKKSEFSIQKTTLTQCLIAGIVSSPTSTCTRLDLVFSRAMLQFTSIIKHVNQNVNTYEAFNRQLDVTLNE